MRPYDERLEDFLTRAAGVFAARRYHATTMRDLARCTGMSPAGMYYYVTGKEELLFRIQNRCYRRLLAGAEEALAPLAHADPTERFEAFIRHHLQFFTVHHAEMKVLVQERWELERERFRTVAEIQRRYLELFANVLNDVRPDFGRDPGGTASIFFGWMMNGLDGGMDADEIAMLFLRLFVGGAAPAPSPVDG